MRKTIKVRAEGVNPFLAPLIINVTEVIDGPDSYTVEVDKGVKVYRTIQARECVNMLSPMAAKFFNFMLFRLESGSDLVALKHADFMEYAGVKSSRTFYTCVNELGKAGIIAQVLGKKSLYWINPAICFHGSRINAFPEKVNVKQVYVKRG